MVFKGLANKVCRKVTAFSIESVTKLNKRSSFMFLNT